ncbi:MAG: hypothetical protein ACOCRX_03670 [Candidatus Woesearchaeota archaeon]
MIKIYIKDLVGKTLKVIDVKKAEWDESSILYDRIVVKIEDENFILKSDSWDESCLSIEKCSEI